MPLRNYLNENMTEEERLLSFKRKQHIHHNESLAPFGERNNYAFHFSDIQRAPDTRLHYIQALLHEQWKCPCGTFFDKPLHAEVVYNLTSSAFLLKLSI